MAHGAEVRNLAPHVRAILRAEAAFELPPVGRGLLRRRACEAVSGEHHRLAAGAGPEVEALFVEVAGRVARDQGERAVIGLLAGRQVERRAAGDRDPAAFEGNAHARPDVLERDALVLHEGREQRSAALRQFARDEPERPRLVQRVGVSGPHPRLDAVTGNLHVVAGIAAIIGVEVLPQLVLAHELEPVGEQPARERRIFVGRKELADFGGVGIPEPQAQLVVSDVGFQDVPFEAPREGVELAGIAHPESFARGEEIVFDAGPRRRGAAEQRCEDERASERSKMTIVHILDRF